MPDSVAEAVLAEANRKLNSPYVLGAEGPIKFDCSGLMYWVFRQTGHEQLIGNTRKLAAGYARWFADRGKYSRNLNDAQRGDLICYTHTSSSTRVSHIGIYLGGGDVISALVPPYGVRRHGALSIGVDFDGVCLVDYPSDPGRTGPDDTPSQPGDPEVFVSPTTPRWLGVIQILYEGVDITHDVQFSTARFVTQAGGEPGEAYIRVRDKAHAYPPGYFHTGGTLELWINGRREWDGWVMNPAREYAFPVDDTPGKTPIATPRWWALEGVDRNVLFVRRFHLDKANPSNADFGTYPAGTVDQTIVRDILANYTTLDDDGLDLETGIEAVGPVDPYESVKVVGLGMQWGESMRKIALFNGAINYIDPDRVVRYVDDMVESAPFALSDQPDEGEVGYRELEIHYLAGEMYNEAFIWGVGVGSDVPAFSHVINEDAINEHGLFQYGEAVQGMYKQASVERRADTLINGSPQHQRGHKDDVLRISCSIFQPGLRVGQGVSFRSAAWDFGDLFFDPGDLESPPLPPGGNDFERLLYQIGKIESNNTYTRQNRRSFAYGRWQVMPGNWRVWGPLALGLPRSVGVASREIPPESWFPEPTPENQDRVINWRMGKMYNNQGDPRRVAASWRSGASVGSGEPSSWSRGTLLYVNHATVPLGYPPTTNDTVLAPLTEPIEARGDWQTSVSADDVYPVRRIEMTFPTPNSVRFDLLLSHSLDAAWAFQDPYPTPADPPPIGPTGFPMTELITLYNPGTAWTEPQPPFIFEPIDDDQTYFLDADKGLRRNKDGQALIEGLTPGAIYSSVGIENGFAANIPFTETTCGIGPGAWTNWEDSEAWYEAPTAQGVVGFDSLGAPIMMSLIDVNRYFALEVSMGDTSISGYVPGVAVRIASSAPVEGMYGAGAAVASMGSSDSDGAGERVVSFRSGIIPAGALGEGDWIVVGPAWTSERLEFPSYWCDAGYTLIWGADEATGTSCFAKGPRCTGMGNSGVVSLVGGPLISLKPIGWPGGISGSPRSWTTQPVAGVENFPATFWLGGQYRTIYPYAPGTLEVTWQGVLLTRGVEYFETDPANGIFELNNPGSGEGSITIRYWVPPGANPTDPLPGEPWYSEPLPGDPTVPTGTGRVYRPRVQRQLGWGTPWDGANCNMASSAMALDRHTLGAHSDINGSPLSTPPAHRSYAGEATYPVNRQGTNLNDAQQAWSNGWSQTLLTPGPVSWDYFRVQINTNRGAIVHGLPSTLPPGLKKTNWPDAHAVYVNEQLPDGSFWVVDPLYREPLLYPESVLRTYATSLHGFRDVVTCAFTRQTPGV